MAETKEKKKERIKESNISTGIFFFFERISFHKKQINIP